MKKNKYNSIFGGNMKRILLLILVFSFSVVLFGQSIAINKMGLRNYSNGTSSVAIGDVVEVAIEYSCTATSIGSPNTFNPPLFGGFWGDTDELITCDFLDNSTDLNELTSIDVSTITNVDGTGFSGTLTFRFTLPNPNNSSAGAVQLIAGLKTSVNGGASSTKYASRTATFMGTSALDDAPTSYYEVLTIATDNTTEAPTLNQPLQDEHEDGSVYIEFNLPEDANDNTIKLTFTRTGGTADAGSPHVLLLANSLGDAGTHSFTLDVTSNMANDANVQSVDSGGSTLVADTEYSVKIEYEDFNGNTADSDTNTGVVADDNTTESATLTSPATSGNSSGSTFDITYNLSEDAGTSGGAVQCWVTFTESGTSLDSNDPHQMRISSSYATSGSHTISNVTGTSMGSHAQLTHADAGNGVLVNGAQYNVEISYKDELLNTAATAQNTAWTFQSDTSTEEPSMTNPTNDSNYGPEINPIIGYSLPEAAYSGSIKLYFYDDAAKSSLLSTWSLSATAGHTAATHDHTYTDTDGDGWFNDDDSWVSTQSAALATDVYYVFVGYQDTNQNDEAVSAGSRYFNYDRTAPTPSMTGATNLSGSDFTLNYSLNEEAKSNEVFFYFYNGATLRSKVSYTNAQNGSTGGKSVTLNGTSLNNVAGQNNLVEDVEYTVKISHLDIADNDSGESATSSSFTYTNDAGTEPVITLDATQEINASEGSVLDVSYTLPEDGTSGSVELWFDTTDAGDGSFTKITVAGNYSSGAKNFNLTEPFTTSDAGGDSDQVTSIDGSTTLVHGTTYYMYVRYQDAIGNAAVNSSSSASFTWDGQTNSSVTVTAPTVDSYQTETFNYTYQLPETGKDGTVKILLYSNNSPETLYSTLTLATGRDLNNTAQHVISIDPTNMAASLDIASASTSELVDDSDMPKTYWVRLEYQDQYANTAAQTALRRFYFDDTTKAFSVQPTFSNVATNTDVIEISYTLPEDASLVYVYLYDLGRLLNSRSLSRNVDIESLLRRTSSADRSRALRSKLTVADTDSYYIAGASRTLSLNASNLLNNAEVTSINSTNNSLEDGTDYYAMIEYNDVAENGLVQSTDSTTDTYQYDGTTTAPTMTSVSEIYHADGPKLRVAYNLPEAGTNNTIQILVCNTNSSADVRNTISITGNYTSGAHSIDLTVPFTTDDVAVSGVTGTTSLVHNTTYYYFVKYQDSEGNAAATSVASQSNTWDSQTQTPTLNDPSDGDVDNSTLTINVTFPETAYSNTMKLYISDNVARASATLTLTGISSGGNFTLDGSDLSAGANANVSNAAGALGSLTNGNAYDIYFGYQDEYGNDEAVTSTNTFTYDSATQAPNIDSPASGNDISNPFTLQYDLPEDADDGTLYVEFTRTGGAADANTHKFIISSEVAGDNIQITDIDPTNIDGHASLTLDGISTDALVDGAIYTVTLGYQDTVPNAEATDTSTGCEYSSASVTVNITIGDEGNNPLDGADSENQVVYVFDLQTEASTCTFTSVTFTKGGSALSGDFDASGFKLWCDDGDDVFESGQDDDMGSAGGTYTDWTHTSWGTTFTISGSNDDITDSGKTFFLTADLSSSAVETRDFKVTLNSTTDIVTDADTESGSFPLSGNLHYLDGYFTISGGDYGDAAFTPGTDDNPFFTFNVSVNQGTDTMTRVDISLSGTAVDGDFPDTNDAFQLYVNDSADFAGATAIGSAIDFNSSLSFTGLTEEITTSTKYYFLTCDIDSDAVGTHTVQATLTAADDEPTFTNYANILDADAGAISGEIHTLPVELSAFNITNTGRIVNLEWTTQTETENQGFNLWRGSSESSLDDGTAYKVNGANLIPGAINSSEPVDYHYDDNYRIDYGRTYYYWLESIDLNGIQELASFASFTPINNQNDGNTNLTPVPGLHANYPNPFNPRTYIEFAVDSSTRAILDIYNVRGQHIANIFDETAAPDKYYRVMWNGKDSNDKDVAAGVYFYRLRTNEIDETKRMLLLK